MKFTLAAAALSLLVISSDLASAQTTTRDHRPPNTPPGWGQSERPGRQVTGAGKPGGVVVRVTKNGGRR
jgi:hypothetical protein